MLEPEKIVLMTRLASFEKNEARANSNIWNYFRGDYIGWQVLKSIVSGTIVFCILFAGVVVYDFENFMMEIYKMDLMEYARTLLIRYVIFIAVYSLITYIVFAVRYTKARRKLRTYAHNLNKLSRSYNEEV